LKVRIHAEETQLKTDLFPPTADNFFQYELSGAFLLPALFRDRYALEPIPNRSGDRIVAGHVPSLMAGHLTDVAASDRHTVKLCPTARVDFSRSVYELAREAFR
jgi:hypothetical protein